MRLLAEQEEVKALTGRGGSADGAIRIANVVARFERDLHLTTKGKPRSGGADLQSYLAELAQRDEDADADVADDAGAAP